MPVTRDLTPCVEFVAALPEVADDAFAVLDGVVVVVLELGVHLQHLQLDAADAGQHPPVRRCAGGHGGVAAFGLEVGELGGADLRLALRVVDHGWPAQELRDGVVAGRHQTGFGRAR